MWRNQNVAASKQETKDSDFHVAREGLRGATCPEAKEQMVATREPSVKLVEQRKYQHRERNPTNDEEPCQGVLLYEHCDLPSHHLHRNGSCSDLLRIVVVILRLCSVFIVSLIMVTEIMHQKRAYLVQRVKKE